ncbi:MAG: 1,4-dihydroxy-2-naphthoate octaprenyltransferase [Chloroflexi bacterium]|nr:1,4-dihydroxy-2-naphthoate octaprenyltransferase [Chloroflexota bacterium]
MVRKGPGKARRGPPPGGGSARRNGSAPGPQEQRLEHARRDLAFYVEVWVLAARPITLTAAVVPVLVGTALAARQGPVDWLLFALAFCGAVLIQVGTNLADEYTDHRKQGGQDKYPAPHKVIARGLLPPGAVLQGTAISFGLSTVMGLYIVSQVGWPILVVGLLSTLAGYLHSSGPFPLGHHLLGELTVFVFMGPLIVMSAYFVQTAGVTWPVFWASVPVGLLVTAILQANNLRDRDDDRAGGKRTFATLLSLQAGRWVFAWLVYLAYAVMVVDAMSGVLPWYALLALLSMPQAFKTVRLLARAGGRPAFNAVLVGTAKLHMQAGLLLALGIAVDFVLKGRNAVF